LDFWAFAAVTCVGVPFHAILAGASFVSHLGGFSMRRVLWFLVAGLGKFDANTGVVSLANFQ